MRRKVPISTPSSKPSRHIYAAEVTDCSGEKFHVIASKPLTNQSVRLNAQQDFLNKKTNAVSKQTITGAWFLMNTLFCYGNIWCHGTIPADGIKEPVALMIPDVWKVVFEFTFGISQHDTLEELGHYAIAINRPSVFAQIKMDIARVIDAVVRADEDKMQNILNANPTYLLKRLTLDPEKNYASIGAPFTGLQAAAHYQIKLTPFQAALACGDGDMCKMMAKQFARLTTDLEGNPIDSIAEMKKQYAEMIIKSLQHYLNKQKNKITQLIALQSGLEQNNPSYADTYQDIEDQIKTAQKNVCAYTKALNDSKSCSEIDEDRSIKIIEEAHSQAQTDNQFDAGPYFDAIESATSAEIDALYAIITVKTAELDAAIQATGTSFTQTDACRNKPFDQLNLFEKMNRYREELKRHMDEEIIFNPNHMKNTINISHDKCWMMSKNRTDKNYKKRDVILTMGVGITQRFASESYRQDMRQGSYYLVEENESRVRQSRFNNRCRCDIIPNVLVDDSLSNPSRVDNWGFKFAVGSAGNRASSSQNDAGVIESIFHSLCRQKHLTWQAYKAHATSCTVARI